MRRSEIFESFIKIAQDKGLVSKDAPEKAIQKLTKTHRHDSLSADDIAKLYGIKPDQPKGMEYKRNIIEDAHPDMVIVSPSYDKLNGLVENENQRQDITLHILNKTPHGQLDNHKWAEKDLLLTLVRLGNDLDNKGKNDLRSLADVCLTQVSKPFKKEAYWQLLVAVPLVLGALYAQQHLPFANEGFNKNTEKLIAEIDDLLESNTNWGIGTKYKPEFMQEMQDFKNKITDLANAANGAEQIISQLQKPRDAKEAIEISKQPETNTVTVAYQALRSKIANLTPYIKTVLNNFSNQNYKNTQTEEKGALTSLVDKTQVLHGGNSLVADDFDDVRRAIAPWRASLIDIIKVLRESGNIVAKAKQDLASSANEDASDFGPPLEGVAPTAANPEDAIKGEIAKLDRMIPNIR